MHTFRNIFLLELRFGGTDADLTYYDTIDTPVTTTETILNSTMMDAVAAFAASTNTDLMFTVNLLNRTVQNTWNPTNFETLLTYTKNNNLKIYAWELGNVGFCCFFESILTFLCESCHKACEKNLCGLIF